MQGKKVGAFAESAEIRSVQIASPALPSVWTCEDGHVFDIGPVAFEVDVFAGERLQIGEGRFADGVEARPEVDGLASD